MKIFHFILGVLGILLIVGTFSSFISLFFLGGLATGSVGLAFVFPIFLMAIGAAMVYFGFYYHGSRSKSDYQLGNIMKWGIIYTLAILLSIYVFNQLSIFNSLLVILLTSTIVSIATQIVRSHESHFNLRWFIFYFLVYATVILVMNEFILPGLSFQSGILSSLVVGFTLAGVVVIIQKLNIKYNSIQWISIILVVLLLVTSVESFEGFSIGPITTQFGNSSDLPENKKDCPTNTQSEMNRPLSEMAINPESISPVINKAVDNSIWKIEGNIRTCYSGRYRGQYPDWIYCDDMIVSRWETSNSGTIKYRWYSAVTAEWRPEEGNNYIFDSFSCENGKAVKVDKEKPSIYVHDSKDGTVINVHISRDGTETTIDY